MAHNYNVDDILEEIRRKKAQQQGGASSAARRPATATRERPDRPASRQETPRSGAADVRRPPVSERETPQGRDSAGQRPQARRPLQEQAGQADYDERQKRRQSFEELDDTSRARSQRLSREAEQEPPEIPQRKSGFNFQPSEKREPTPEPQARATRPEPKAREMRRSDTRPPAPEVKERPAAGRRLSAFEEEPAVANERKPRDIPAYDAAEQQTSRRSETAFGEKMFTIPTRKEPEQERPAQKFTYTPDEQDDLTSGGRFGSRADESARQTKAERPLQREAAFEREEPVAKQPAAPQAFENDNFVLPNFEDTTDLPKEQQTSSAKFASYVSESEFEQDRPHAADQSARYTDSAFTQEIHQPRPRRKRMGFNREEEDNNDLIRSPWHDSYAAQELLEQDTHGEDDFATPQDAPYVEKELLGIHNGLKVKTIFVAVCAFLSIYLTLSLRELPFADLLKIPKGVLLPLPPLIAPEKNPHVFLAAHLILCIAVSLLGSSIVTSGVRALFKMQANHDTPTALAMFGVIIQGIVLLFYPETIMESNYVSLYFSVAILIMLFSLFGKLSLIKRVRRNFDFMMDGHEKYAFAQIQSRDFEREFTRGLGPQPGRVAYVVKSGFFTRFLDKSYSSDYGESLTRISVPVSLAGAVLVSVITAVLSKNPATSVSAFAAILCVCAPFSGTLVPNLMLGRLSKKLTRLGLMLPGYEAAENVDDIGAVIMTDRDIFLPENVVMHGMKVFAEKRIDEAILDAASVIISCDGVMSGVFMNMIGGERRLLRSVDSIMYEDGMGISAWVDGKRVLIGNQELMRMHDVDCPSRDFESRYARDGRQVLYLANSGELTAMFVVSYNGDPLTADLLKGLEARGVYPVVWTTDPNVTADQISLAFGIKRTHVKVMPAKLHGEYHFLVRPKTKINADGVMQDTSLENIWMIVRAAFAVKASVIRASIVQLIGIIVGYGIIALMAFTASLSPTSYLLLTVYQLICFAVASIVALLPRS